MNDSWLRTFTILFFSNIYRLSADFAGVTVSPSDYSSSILFQDKEAYGYGMLQHYDGFTYQALKEVSGFKIHNCVLIFKNTKITFQEHL